MAVKNGTFFYGHFRKPPKRGFWMFSSIDKSLSGNGY